MIDVKQAIQAAKESLLGYYQDADIKDLLLEEVELTDDERFWKITLGFSIPQELSQSPASVALARISAAHPFSTPKYDRKYKLFKIDANKGDVKSMTIRAI